MPLLKNRSNSYLSEELERVQRRAMRTIFTGMKYKEALQGHLQSLYDLRESIHFPYLKTPLYLVKHLK